MFERRIWWIGNIFLICILLLSLRIPYWQLVRGNELYYSVLNPGGSNSSPAWLTSQGLQNLPQPLMQRAVGLLNETTRGKIYDRNGTVLAEDKVDADGNRVRVYTDPSLAPVIGYTSGVRLGIAGLEQRYNGSLLGLNRPDAQLQQLVHQPVTGSDLVLTIDENVQQAAVQAMGGRAGAVVAFNAKDGSVLAMVSTPYLDPNRVNETGYLGSITSSGGPSPLINRATQGQYPPGSTFKTVTLIAALDTGQVSPETVFDFGQPVVNPSTGKSYYVYRVGGGEIPDPNHTQSKLDLYMAYALSANAAFAKLGDEMDPNTFIEYGQRFGFSAPDGKGIPMDVPYAEPQLANNLDDLRANDLLRAATAIGQGELLTNPYTMGVVALAAMDGGSLPVPHVVQTIHDPTGLSRKGPLAGQRITGLMKAQTAKEVREAMITGVQKGYANHGQIPDATVGGKTGTAQLGGAAAPHAWYLGFAQRGDATVVIVVMVENGGEGSVVAAPVFAQVAGPALDAAAKPATGIH